MRLIVGILLLGLALSAKSQQPDFSADETRKIVSHGPWPPPARRDPTNRVSGKREAIALGERLFFEPRLSGPGSVLCASCHAPFRQFQDGRERAFGLELLERNTPTLVNAGFYRRYGWDGAQDSLWAQSIRPLLDPREMRASAPHIGKVLRTRFAADYRKAFDRDVPLDDEEALVDAGKALAAFQETLVSARTPFDEFRDALERGDAQAMGRYPAAAQRGLAIFVGKGNCSVCHSGPSFTNSVELQQRPVGAFRVPGLRDVARTAPYMHDGSLATLRDVLRHHSALGESEREDLVAFLESLSQMVRRD